MVANFISDSVFGGTLIMVPCLLIIHLGKIKLFKIDKPVLVMAVNWVLLFASVLYALMLFIEVFKAYFFAGEYEQFAFSNRFIGPFWLYELMAIVNYILLPQILWFQRFRKSVVCSAIIVGCWIIFRFTNALFILFTTFSLTPSQGDKTWINFKVDYSLQEFLTYIGMVIITYFILGRRSTQLVKPT